MIQEEIVIYNSLLYKYNKPFNYKGIDISYILLHKLAGYNGLMHGYSNDIVEAEKHYNKRFIVIENKLIKYDLKQLILYNQLKQDSLVFFSKNYRKSLASFHQSLEKRYQSSDYVPLEVDLRAANDCSFDYSLYKTDSFIFLATMDNYLNPMIPVIDELLKRNEKVIVVLPLASREWNNFTKISDSKILFIENLFSKIIKKQFSDGLIHIEQIFKMSLSAFRKNVNYKGIKYFNVFQRNFKEVYVNYIPHVCAYIDMCELMIASLKPKALFVARLRRSVEITFNEVFRKHGISTNMIIHGHIDNNDSLFFSDGYFDSVNRIFAWDFMQKNKLMNKKYQSVKPENIYVCGNPIWDQILFRRKNNLFVSKKDIKSILNIKKNYLLLITQDFNIEGYKKVINIIINDTDYSLVIKVHPNENEERYYNYRNNERIHIVKKCEGYDLHSLIYNSKMVLTHSSSTNLECIYCGKTVVTLLIDEFNGNPALNDMTKYGMPVIYNNKELLNILNSDKKHTSPLIDQNCATKKICKIILNE